MSRTESRNEPPQEKPDPAYGTIDERTKAVVANGNSWALQFLLFALLLDVICRSLIRKEASWDLMALVIIAGGISTVYQYKHHVFARGLRWPMLVAGMGAVFGIVFVVLLAIIRWVAR